MGKRKHKDKSSHIRKKIKRLEERLRYAESDSSTREEYFETSYNENRDPRRYRSYTPPSNYDLPLSDSETEGSYPEPRSVVVAPGTGASVEAIVDQTGNTNTVVRETVPSSNAIPINPGPSTSSEPTPLPDDILEALGNPKGKEEVFGPKIPEEIAKRWGRVLVEGLTKEQKQDITEKFNIPDNFRLAKAPILNPEIIPVLSEAARNRDKALEKSQNQLGLGISGLTNLASTVIEGKIDKIEILKKISEVSQIFLDLHYEDTNRRRKLVTSSLDKKFLHMITDVKRDTFLFGTNLGDKIRASKTAERSGLQIRRNDASSTYNTKKSSQSSGNWRSPAQSLRGHGQGGPRNRYSYQPQPYQPGRRPPPPPDRQQRAPPPKATAKTRETQ